MDADRRKRHERMLRGLILAALVLSVFSYVVLLVILPFVFGPWAFVLAIIVALEAAYVARTRRRRRPDRRRFVWHPGRTPAVRNSTRLVAGEVAAGFILGAFAVLLLWIGTSIRWQTIAVDDAWPAYVFGVVASRFGLFVLRGLEAEATYYESVDTTDDR